MIRDFSFSDVCLPSGLEINEVVLDILRETYPMLCFLGCCDYDRDNIKFVILDRTTKETLQRFKYNGWDFRCGKVNKAFDEIAEWCENYCNPKLEPVKKPEPTIIRPHHCECCGAPLKKDQDKCEYCGTEYF